LWNENTCDLRLKDFAHSGCADLSEIENSWAAYSK
jgi:hypothetical protein